MELLVLMTGASPLPERRALRDRRIRVDALRVRLGALLDVLDETLACLIEKIFLKTEKN